MPNNYLLTGAPRSGKTTVVERVLDRIEDRGFTIGGVYSPEIRVEGDRVGFEIVDALTGESAVMAHRDFDAGPRVGSYRVDVGNVDAVAGTAVSEGLDVADLLVVDEIAPMEVESEVFVREVRRALDADLPVVGVVHQRSTSGFIGEVKTRADTEVLEVTRANRDSLPDRLAGRLLDALGGY